MLLWNYLKIVCFDSMINMLLVSLNDVLGKGISKCSQNAWPFYLQTSWDVRNIFFWVFPPSYADGWLISLHAENWFLQILTFNHLVEFFIFALIYNFSFFFHWTIFSDSHHSSPKFLADIFNIFSLVFLLYFSIFAICHFSDSKNK